MAQVECVYSGICHLGEGPVWNVQRKKLYWTDIYNRRIWEYDPAGGTSRIFREVGLQVGGFAFTPRGGVVLCSDKGVYLLDVADAENAASPAGDNMSGRDATTTDNTAAGRDLFAGDNVSAGRDATTADNASAGRDLPAGKGEGKRKLKLLFDFPFAENEMFNDITVDPMGRIFAGTITRPEMTGGTLYRLEKGKKPVTVLKDLHCSNGMTFSLDEKYFYHTDSSFQTIKRYEYDSVTGDIGNPTVFFKGEPEMGSPDGMTMDSEGCIWSAFWGDSRIRRLDPDGRIIDEVEVPAKQPSSVMFGGTGLKELYITTACEGADDLVSGCSNGGVFLGGPVYRCIPGVTGRPEWLADF